MRSPMLGISREAALHMMEEIARPSMQRPFVPNTSTPHAAAGEANIQKAVREALAADRKRHTEILSLPEAKGRKVLAEQLFLSERSVDEIRAALAAAPTDARAKSDAIAKRAVANHRGETPPGQKPSATTKRVVAGLRARGFGQSNP